MSDAGALVVRGGATSTAVELDDLDRFGEILADLARNVAGQGLLLQGQLGNTDLVLSAPLSPFTAARAETAIAQAVWEVLRCAVELGLLAARLRTAAAAYRAAERAQVMLWRELDVVAGLVVGTTLPAVAAATSVGGLAGGVALWRVSPELALRAGERAVDAAGDAALAALADHPEAVSHLVNGLPGLAAGMSPPFRLMPGVVAGAAVGAAASHEGALPRASGLVATLFTAGRFRVVESTPPAPPPAPVGVADLARLLMPAASAPRGWVDVHALEVRQRDGTSVTTYLVVLPGTEDWSLPWAQRETTSARDLGSNLQLMALQRSQLTAALPDLLTRAGVPSGAQVALVGHSQGGLVAVQAADDDAVRALVRVTDVVTFGAPVALLPPPRDVHVLSLENQGDVVPQLDGADNPDRADHVTVAFDGGQAPATTDPLGYPHQMSQYLTGAGLADRAAAAGDEGLAAAIAGLRLRSVLHPNGSPVRVRSRRFVVSVDRSGTSNGRARSADGPVGRPLVCHPGVRRPGPPPLVRPDDVRPGVEPGP